MDPNTPQVWEVSRSQEESGFLCSSEVLNTFSLTREGLSLTRSLTRTEVCLNLDQILHL